MKKAIKKEENKQMELGLRSPIANIYFNLKRKVQGWLLYFDAASYFRDPINWLYIILSLSLLTIQLYFIITTYEVLPSQLPLFTYFTQPDKKLVNEVYIWLLPALTVIMVIVASQYSYKYFHKERLLTRVLLLILLLSTILISILTLRTTMPYYG